MLDERRPGGGGLVGTRRARGGPWATCAFRGKNERGGGAGGGGEGSRASLSIRSP